MYKRDPRKQGMQQYGFTGPAQMQPIQGMAPPPTAPLQKGVTEQFTDMAKQRVMTAGLDKGMEYGTQGLTMAKDALLGHAATGAGATGASAATGAGAAGMMGSLGTVMPYVGMGLLAGQALGLFSKGGYVGPLASVAYKSDGGKITANFYNTTKE